MTVLTVSLTVGEQDGFPARPPLPTPVLSNLMDSKTALQDPVYVYADDVSVERATRMRWRLIANAWMFEDARAYAAGIEDACSAVAELYGLPSLQEALCRPPQPDVTAAEEELPPPGGWFG